MREFAVGAGVLGNLSAAYFLWLRGNADSRWPHARSLRPAPAHHSCRALLRRRLRPVCHRHDADHGHRRPLPNRRRGGFLPSAAWWLPASGSRHRALPCCLVLPWQWAWRAACSAKRLCAWRSRRPTGARPISPSASAGSPSPFPRGFPYATAGAARGASANPCSPISPLIEASPDWLVAWPGFRTHPDHCSALLPALPGAPPTPAGGLRLERLKPRPSPRCSSWVGGRCAGLLWLALRPHRPPATGDDGGPAARDRVAASLVYWPTPPALLAGLCFLDRHLSGWHKSSALAIAKENHPPRLAGHRAGPGFVDAMVTGGRGGLFQPLMGLLLVLASARLQRRNLWQAHAL